MKVRVEVIGAIISYDFAGKFNGYQAANNYPKKNKGSNVNRPKQLF